MNRAKELLRETDLPVTEICQAVGYSDQNYFSRVFKKHTRMGPNEYRRSLTGG